VLEVSIKRTPALPAHTTSEATPAYFKRGFLCNQSFTFCNHNFTICIVCFTLLNFALLKFALQHP
jgi:hypothetical protein